MSKSLIEKAYDVYNEKGITGLIEIGSAKACRSFYTKEAYLYEMVVDEYMRSIKYIPNYSIKPLDAYLLEKIAGDYPKEFSIERYDTLKSRLNENSDDRCFVVFDKSEILGYCNIGYGQYLETGTNIILEKQNKEAYFFDDYVFKCHRRKNVHFFSLYYRFKITQEQGYKKAKVVIEKGNIGSEKTYSKFGAIKCLYIKRYHFGFIDKTITKVVK